MKERVTKTDKPVSDAAIARLRELYHEGVRQAQEGTYTGINSAQQSVNDKASQESSKNPAQV